MYRRSLIAAASAVAALSLWAVRSSSSDFRLHLALVKSEPTADAEVAPPSELRLWFTEEPEPGTMSIRLVNASGELVPTGDVAAEPDDGKVFSVAVETPPADGAYTVSWRAMADDGHVTTEQFGFTIKRTE